MEKKLHYRLSIKPLFASLMLLFMTLSVLKAENHVILFGGTVGFNYSPAELSVAVGDTVTWQGSFSSHPLSSTSVPQGAASFQNGSGSSFSYLVTVQGTYNYKCDIHAGMTGSFSATVSSVEENAVLPDIFHLDQNYPNPFNPSTTIAFTLPKAEYVDLKIFDSLGKEVTRIVTDKLDPGNHVYHFDRHDLASGVYYYQLVAGEFRGVKKMILLR
jgi:plastocyanin